MFVYAIETWIVSASIPELSKKPSKPSRVRLLGSELPMAFLLLPPSATLAAAFFLRGVGVLRRVARLPKSPSLGSSPSSLPMVLSGAVSGSA